MEMARCARSICRGIYPHIVKAYHQRKANDKPCQQSQKQNLFTARFRHISGYTYIYTINLSKGNYFSANSKRFRRFLGSATPTFSEKNFQHQTF
jgi:hypothetical protein